ncbi:MAG TPA: TIGR00730 family Rossman fold protein [Rhizomicrobium sp.]
MKKPVTIGVFCGSSSGTGPQYLEAAKRFGTLVGENGFRFLFGGGRLGLMGESAIAAYEAGARVLGIMPEFLRHIEPPLKSAQEETIFVSSLFDRKKMMTERSDAFVILPGGLGTLDEFFEVLVGAQLLVHQKPIVLVNLDGYYDPLVDLVEHVIAFGFAGPAATGLYTVVATPDDAMAVLKAQLARQPPLAESALPD